MRPFERRRIARDAVNEARQEKPNATRAEIKAGAEEILRTEYGDTSGVDLDQLIRWVEFFIDLFDRIRNRQQ